MTSRIARALALVALLIPAASRAELAPTAPPAPEPDRKIDWTAGPATVAIGDALAEVRLPETLAFAGPEDTRHILESMGNRTDGSELGLVVPKAEDQGWFIVFEWNDVGYVKDDEKDEIDADALLASLREGTEASNAWRKEHGLPALHVVGWSQPPRYDEKTHNLTWATLGRNDEGHESVNYNVRVLGRAGVMSVTFVDEPENLAAAKPAVDEVIAAFAYKQGKSYAEWVPGDKVAEYGLTALVAGGAGAAAAKLGLLGWLGKLFAKAGKLVVVALAAIGAGLAKFWGALRGKAPARRAAPGPGPGAGPGPA